MWAALPTPILKVLHMTWTRTTELFHGRLSGVPEPRVPLGGRKTGSMFAQETLFGPLFPSLRRDVPVSL